MEGIPRAEGLQKQLDANKEFSERVHFWDKTFAQDDMDFEQKKAVDAQADAELLSVLRETHQVGARYLVTGPALWYESGVPEQDETSGTTISAPRDKILRNEWVAMRPARLFHTVMADPREEGIHRAWYIFDLCENEVLDNTMLNLDVRRKFMAVEAARADLIIDESDKEVARPPSLMELAAIDRDLADYACEYDLIQLSPGYDKLPAADKHKVREDFVAYAESLVPIQGTQAILQTSMVFAVNHFGGPYRYNTVPTEHTPFSCTPLAVTSESRADLGFSVDEYEDDAHELCLIVRMDNDYSDPFKHLVFQKGQLLTVPLSTQEVALYFYAKE